MFMLTEIEYWHQIGANSVIDCMGYMLADMGYMVNTGTYIDSTVKIESSRLDSVRPTVNC